MILRVASQLFLALSAVLLALPIIVVSGAALNSGRTMFFPPREPTFERFYEFFVAEPVWVEALTNSMIIAFASAGLAVLIAWPVAYGLWARGSRASQVLAGLGSMPFALPPIVFGVGLGFLWSFLGGLGQVWAGVISHAALFLALPSTLQHNEHIRATLTGAAPRAPLIATIRSPSRTFTPYRASGASSSGWSGSLR